MLRVKVIKFYKKIFLFSLSIFLSGFSNPTKGTTGEDYVADDDYAEYNDEDNKSEQSNKESEKNVSPVYIEAKEYNKTAKVGDTVVLECNAKNIKSK